METKGYCIESDTGLTGDPKCFVSESEHVSLDWGTGLNLMLMPFNALLPSRSLTVGWLWIHPSGEFCRSYCEMGSYMTPKMTTGQRNSSLFKIKFKLKYMMIVEWINESVEGNLVHSLISSTLHITPLMNSTQKIAVCSYYRFKNWAQEFSD